MKRLFTQLLALTALFVFSAGYASAQTVVLDWAAGAEAVDPTVGTIEFVATNGTGAVNSSTITIGEVAYTTISFGNNYKTGDNHIVLKAASGNFLAGDKLTLETVVSVTDEAKLTGNTLRIIGITADGTDVLTEEIGNIGIGGSPSTFEYSLGKETETILMGRQAGTRVHLLSVKVEREGSSIAEPEEVVKVVADVRYFDVTGRATTADAKGLVIVQTVYEDGSRDAKKIYK